MSKKRSIRSKLFLAATIPYALNEVAQQLHVNGHKIYDFTGGSLMRNHLSSLAGAYVLAHLSEDTLEKLGHSSPDNIIKPSLRTEFAVATTGLTLTAFELVSMAGWQKGVFDWGDMTAYALALMTYYGATKKFPVMEAESVITPASQRNQGPD